MPREFSAGGVVVRRMQGKWWIAAIEPQSRSGEDRAAVLALPKGIVDPGETPEQTAVREVREEAGLEAELVAKLADVKYVYVRKWSDNARIFKVVSFYLLKYRSGKIGEIDEKMRVEVKSAQWLALEEAPKRLSYRGERDAAAKALEIVRSWETKD